MKTEQKPNEDMVLPILSRMYEDGRNDLAVCEWIEGVVRRALDNRESLMVQPPETR